MTMAHRDRGEGQSTGRGSVMRSHRRAPRAHERGRVVVVGSPDRAPARYGQRGHHDPGPAPAPHARHLRPPRGRRRTGWGAPRRGVAGFVQRRAREGPTPAAFGAGSSPRRPPSPARRARTAARSPPRPPARRPAAATAAGPGPRRRAGRMPGPMAWRPRRRRAPRWRSRPGRGRPPRTRAPSRPVRSRRRCAPSDADVGPDDRERDRPRGAPPGRARRRAPGARAWPPPRPERHDHSQQGAERDHGRHGERLRRQRERRAGDDAERSELELGVAQEEVEPAAVGGGAGEDQARGVAEEVPRRRAVRCRRPPRTRPAPSRPGRRRPRRATPTGAAGRSWLASSGSPGWGEADGRLNGC